MSYTDKNNQPILKSIYYNVNLGEKYNVMFKDIVKIMFNLINAIKKIMNSSIIQQGHIE